MGKIILPHQSFTFDAIKGGNWSESDPYFSDSLRFCQDWMQGKSSFELKTSGSTGIPKSIIVRRSQMETSARATSGFFQIPLRPRLLCCLNTEMIAGKMMLVRGMEWNADVHLVKPVANPFFEKGLPERFDFVAMVPLQLNACFKSSESIKFLQNIKSLLIGGAGLSNELFEKIKEFKLNAYQSFGMTETVSHFAIARIEGETLIYHALPGVEIGADQNGKLWVKAPMAIEPLLQTNDLVEMVDPVSFVWKGRTDFTINSGGVKIQPEVLETQIESLIQSVLGDIPFIIAGKRDDLLGQKCVLLLESDQIGEIQVDRLMDSFARHLPKYQVPKEVYCLPQFVRTSSGKVNRIKTLEILP